MLDWPRLAVISFLAISAGLVSATSHATECAAPQCVRAKAIDRPADCKRAPLTPLPKSLAGVLGLGRPAQVSCPNSWEIQLVSKAEAPEPERERSPLDVMPAPRGLPDRHDANAGDESTTRSNLVALVNALFIGAANHGQGLERLEELAERFRSGRERTPSGIWKLALFYDTLARYESDSDYASDDMPNGFVETVKAWALRYPNSPTPCIVQAIFHLHRAKAARTPAAHREGAGPDSLVHRTRLALARNYLETTKQHAAADPAWYETMMGVLTEEGASPSAIMEVAREAAQREPEYHETYFAAARAIGRQSKEPLEDLEALARSAMSWAATGESVQLYTRIYWVVVQQMTGIEGMNQLRFDWRLMTTGMQGIVERYPAQWNIQHFALFSCVMEDVGEYSRYRSRIPTIPIPMIWHGMDILNHCDAWAQQASAAVPTKR